MFLLRDKNTTKSVKVLLKRTGHRFNQYGHNFWLCGITNINMDKCPRALKSTKFVYFCVLISIIPLMSNITSLRIAKFTLLNG